MHRYILQPYQGRDSRFMCPNCRHSRRTFKRYLDTQTGSYLADHVGKCDRADSCGYHYPPHAWFTDSAGPVANCLPTYQPPSIKQMDTLPAHYVADTTKAYHRNNFIAFLIRLFDHATALRLAALYKIGTSKHWPGATIFWQIDINDQVRTGKIMLYHPADGHRVKQPFNHITWAHRLIKNSKVKIQELESLHLPQASCALANYFRLNQCFFGEHLLNTHPFKTVAIAESEKTAVICNFFYPEYIWLASGSLEGLSLTKCRVLKDRRVLLFPDLNGFDKWKAKAREMNLRIPTATFTVDYTLERWATPEERANGLDMADRWINQLKIK